MGATFMGMVNGLTFMTMTHTSKVYCSVGPPVPLHGLSPPLLPTDGCPMSQRAS